MCACKGTCDRYRSLHNPKNKRYEDGQKRCSKCHIFLYWEGAFCPCCQTRLRTTPRNGPNRKRIVAKMPRI